MSQVTSLNVENSNGLAVRTGFNGLIGAVNSQHSGGTAPTETVPYMMWADTSSTPATLKIRNAANNGWLLIGTIDEAAGQFLPNGQIAGRNLIINGSGRINQREYASGVATSVANQFTLDRWFVLVSGQNLSFTGGPSRRIMTAPAGGVAQVVEGANIVGGTYVLNWDGTATATVNGTVRAKGEAFTLTSGANAVIRFVSGTFTDAQLERGLVATPFEFLNIDHEQSRCHRYFQKVRAGLAFVAAAAGGFSSAPLLYVQKRATPSVSNNGDVNIANLSAASYEEVSSIGARITATAVSSGGCILVQDLNVDAELTS